jgi:hypothetical protein
MAVLPVETDEQGVERATTSYGEIWPIATDPGTSLPGNELTPPLGLGKLAAEQEPHAGAPVEGQK